MISKSKQAKGQSKQIKGDRSKNPEFKKKQTIKTVGYMGGKSPTH